MNTVICGTRYLDLFFFLERDIIDVSSCSNLIFNQVQAHIIGQHLQYEIMFSNS